MARLTIEIVKNWILLGKGSFQLFDIHKELNIVTPEGKSNLRVIMHRLVQDGFIERVGKRDGVFRMLDGNREQIDWESSDPEKTICLNLPFDIHKYVSLYSKNIIVVAGEVNSGKTAFLYNCAVMNMNQPLDFYTNNESSPEEIKKRLTAFDIPSPCPFPIYERYDNWADVIDPDRISVVDYLEMGGDQVYLVGDEIAKIQRKLRSGIAILGLQLPSPTVTFVKGVKKYIHRDLGYGRDFSAMKATLYLSLWKEQGDNAGTCKIIKAKNRVIPLVNPVNMQWRYTIDEFGAKYIKWERYQEQSYTQDF